MFLVIDLSRTMRLDLYHVGDGLAMGAGDNSASLRAKVARMWRWDESLQEERIGWKARSTTSDPTFKVLESGS